MSFRKVCQGFQVKPVNRKAQHLFCFESDFHTFDLSKSGVSSVVVFTGIFVGEIEFIDPLDAEPTPCADADDA